VPLVNRQCGPRPPPIPYSIVGDASLMMSTGNGSRGFGESMSRRHSSRPVKSAHERLERARTVHVRTAKDNFLVGRPATASE
jgi:hypothetical protein